MKTTLIALTALLLVGCSDPSGPEPVGCGRAEFDVTAHLREGFERIHLGRFNLAAQPTTVIDIGSEPVAMLEFEPVTDHPRAGCEDLAFTIDRGQQTWWVTTHAFVEWGPPQTGKVTITATDG